MRGTDAGFQILVKAAEGGADIVASHPEACRIHALLLDMGVDPDRASPALIACAQRYLALLAKLPR